MALVEVVKYDGGSDVYAWRYPNTELGTWTQLIVNEAQEAVLFKGGIACDLFGAGRHTLETLNIPILNNIINLPFGGVSPFSAEVWYVNKAFSLDVKWGTASPIQLQDPKYKIFVPIRAHGQFGVRIEDSKKFLLKLVGTLPSFDQEALSKYFRGVYLTKAKDAISSYFIHKGISLLEINAYLDELSSYIQEQLVLTFNEYGISLVNFYVNSINVPEDDPAVMQLKQALAKKAEMDIIGYNYQQERSFDTLEGAAKNPGSMQSGIMGAGIGLGMGAGIGGVVTNQFSGITKHLATEEMKKCPQCGTSMRLDEKFCSNCGTNVESKSMLATIKCMNCGHALTETTKFCPECGTRAAVVCQKCGNTISVEANFCPECGTKVLNK